MAPRGVGGVCEIEDRPTLCGRSIGLKQTGHGVRLLGFVAQQPPFLSVSGKLWANLFLLCVFMPYNERKLPPPEFVVSFKRVTTCKHLERC